MKMRLSRQKRQQPLQRRPQQQRQLLQREPHRLQSRKRKLKKVHHLILKT